MPEPLPKALQGDVPYGLASAGFPVTFYDRPALMFGNLLRGDVDGLTRSMLSPDTLTPNQMKDVTDMLTKGKKPSPIMRTILDIATNPLVIIGSIAALAYPMGGTNVLLAIRNGLIPKAAAMSKMMSGLHGALMNSRSIPGMWNSLWGVVRNTEKFFEEWGAKFSSVLESASAKGGLSKAENYMISAKLDGLHTNKHYMVKLFQKEPEWLEFFGTKDTPIAANLTKSMSAKAHSAADKLRVIYKGMWNKIRANPAAEKGMEQAAALRGHRIGKEVSEFYHPHQGQFNKYHQASLRGGTGIQYRKYLQKEYKAHLGKSEIERLGGMVVDRNALLEMERAGAIPTGFTEQVSDRILARWTGDAATTVGGIWDDILKAGLTEKQQRLEFVKRVTDYYTKGPGKSTNFVGRLGSRKVAADTLDSMAGALQNAKFTGPEAVQRELQEIGSVLARPAEYSMHPWEVANRYLKGASQDYGWFTTGHGAKINAILETPGVFGDAAHLEQYYVEGLLPHIRGYKTLAHAQRSMLDATRKSKLVQWAKNHPMVEQTLGKNHVESLTQWLAKPSSLSSTAMGGQIANWFHLSTLGLNLSATSANAMQTLITTVNNVGMRGVYRGLMGYAGEPGLISRATKYSELLAKGVAKEKAFNRAFPEFVAEMGSWSKTTNRLLSGDIAASGLTPLFKAKGVWERVKGGLMLPFSGVEAGNQLLAFYSGRNAHLFSNAAKIGLTALSAEANQVGGTLALLTQFAGGPLGIPRRIIDMNPMWRQFMHFPMRYLSWLHGSLRMGVDPSKLDWGTIGRALAGSSAAYIAARNMLGLDLSRGLIAGALPMPGYEKQAFYPFPFVPPAVGLIGETAKALMTGNTRQLGGVGAMLIPGGLAARRAYKSLAPRFADYENPTEDGRIPLYNNDRSLVGSMTPMELTLRSLGLRPSSVSAEAGAAKWLLSQRDRIRQYRRDYTMAVYQNDLQKAEKINKEFQRVYPELGVLQIKKSDIRALENRREISRLHRISRGISRSYRPLFEQVIGEASLGQLTEDIQAGGIEALQNYLQ